ncbi:MAG: M20/M25/M40 family metallo-hydrolase [Acidimicrobiia bacterium]|nr:M20/M25/M40 family metallo-hydrolase [Acidimicrobiia bacterium]
MAHSDLAHAVSEQFPKMVEILSDLVRIPSVSAAGYPAEPMLRSAEAIRDRLLSVGFERAEVVEMEGARPAVYGMIPAPPGAPTVLLYAHHDVQPPGPAEEWETAPFEPFERDGRLFGRGASDDKSGVIMHLGSVAAFDGRPPVGITVFIEGEEESGSVNLARFLDKYAEELRADVIVIGDAGNWRVGQPALTTKLRGLAGCIVEVRTARNAVHSGQFGGVFPDALISLSRVLASLHNDDGSIAVEGLVAGATDPLDLTIDEIRDQMGTVGGLEELGAGGITSRLWTQPAISVLAIDAPPVAEAINQLVPVARAKVSMRLAPGQQAHLAMTALRDHLIESAPWGVEVTILPVDLGEPFEQEIEGPAAEAWIEAMKAVWGRDPVLMGAGGSIPFVADFAQRYPEAAILLTGAGDPTSAIHAPNESQNLDDLEKSVLAQAIAFRLLAG